MGLAEANAVTEPLYNEGEGGVDECDYVADEYEPPPYEEGFEEG